MTLMSAGERRLWERIAKGEHIDPAEAEDRLSFVRKAKSAARARRLSREPRAPGVTKDDRKAAKREETRRIRDEVFVLADGLCERCGWPTPSDLGHLHHARGGSGRRLAEQSVDNCGWLCGGCHRQLHANATYAREFREELSTKRAARRTP